MILNAENENEKSGHASRVRPIESKKGREVKEGPTHAKRRVACAPNHACWPLGTDSSISFLWGGAWRFLSSSSRPPPFLAY